MYVLSAWNDFYEILSVVVGYGRDIPQTDFFCYCKNRKMISSSNFKWISLVKVSISQTVNSET